MKTYKQPSIVSGISVNQILNMDVSDFKSLSKRDLQKITGRLVSAANKRIRRAEAKGVQSPAFAYVKENIGKFSTKGKDINQLRNEFIKAKGFLQSETSTIKGAEAFKKQSIDLLKQEGVQVSNENFDTVMKAVSSLMRNNKKVSGRAMKYRMQEEAEILADKGYTEEEITANLNSRIEEIYIDMMKETTFESPSDLFDFGSSEGY